MDFKRSSLGIEQHTEKIPLQELSERRVPLSVPNRNIKYNHSNVYGESDTVAANATLLAEKLKFHSSRRNSSIASHHNGITSSPSAVDLALELRNLNNSHDIRRRRSSLVERNVSSLSRTTTNMLQDNSSSMSSHSPIVTLGPKSNPISPPSSSSSNHSEKDYVAVRTKGAANTYEFLTKRLVDIKQHVQKTFMQQQERDGLHSPSKSTFSTRRKSSQLLSKGNKVASCPQTDIHSDENQQIQNSIDKKYKPNPKKYEKNAIVKAIISGELSLTKDYVALAKEYKRMENYRNDSPALQVTCVICNSDVFKEGRAPSSSHYETSKQITKVFFPCEHRCVCDGCYNKTFAGMQSRSNNGRRCHSIKCPLCHDEVKLVLDYKKGKEADEYWEWVHEIKPPLPSSFCDNFKSDSKAYIESAMSNSKSESDTCQENMTIVSKKGCIDLDQMRKKSCIIS